MDEKQVTELERELEERYRQDLAAIRRVQELLAQKKAPRHEASCNIQTNETAPPTEQSKPVTPEIVDSDSSRVDVLRDIFRSEPARPFTVAMLLEQLRKRNVAIHAVNPVSSMHTTIRELRKRREIRVHKKGKGKRAGFYIYAGEASEERPLDDVPDKIQGSFENMPQTLNGGGTEE